MVTPSAVKHRSWSVIYPGVIVKCMLKRTVANAASFRVGIVTVHPPRPAPVIKINGIPQASSLQIALMGGRAQYGEIGHLVSIRF